jgi:hypothetical protein
MHALQFDSEKNNRVSDWPVAYAWAEFLWEYPGAGLYAG